MEAEIATTSFDAMEDIEFADGKPHNKSAVSFALQKYAAYLSPQVKSANLSSITGHVGATVVF